MVWLAVARATARLPASAAPGVPAVDEQQLRARAQLEGQAAGAGGARQLQRRRGAGIDEDDGPAALQARIAGANGHLGRGWPSRVVGQHGRQRVALGGAHAVEAGERAVAEAQVAQHRRHPADGREQRRLGRRAARGKALAQRQQVEQQLDEDGGVAAEMPAVGQDLALQLGCQQRLRLRELALVAGDAQVGVDQADQGEKPGIAVGRVAPGGGEVGDLVGEAPHDGGVAFALGAIEQEGRVRQPGDDAAADDLGRPDVRARAAGRSGSTGRPAAGPWSGLRRTQPHRGGAASRSRAARAPRRGRGAGPRTASVPRDWRRSRRARSCRRRPRRRRSHRTRASRAAPAAARRPPASDSASAAAASGACGRAPRAPRAPRPGRQDRCARGRCGGPRLRGDATARRSARRRAGPATEDLPCRSLSALLPAGKGGGGEKVVHEMWISGAGRCLRELHGVGICG